MLTVLNKKLKISNWRRWLKKVDLPIGFSDTNSIHIKVVNPLTQYGGSLEIREIIGSHAKNYYRTKELVMH